MKIGHQIILTWVGILKMKNEREMFEAWCHIDDEFCTHRYTDNCQEYSHDYTQSAWLAWQASAQRQGYKLVPCEPTYKQLDALKNSCELFKKAGVSDLEAHGAYKTMIGASK